MELVEAYEVDYCKIKPWRDVSLTLALTLRSISTGERRRQIVAGSIWSTVDEARKQLQSSVDGAHPIAPCHGSLEEQRPRAQVALVPDMAMILRLFPSDPVLTGLSWATDRTGMTALLDAHLPDCRNEGWRIRDLQHEPLHYKPGRLCTLRYTLTLDHPHRTSKTVELFGKVYRDERWRRSYGLLDATWQAAEASGGVWCAARPIAAVPAWRFIVQRAVGGRQFREQHTSGHIHAGFDGLGADGARGAEDHHVLGTVAREGVVDQVRVGEGAGRKPRRPPGGRALRPLRSGRCGQ